MTAIDQQIRRANHSEPQPREFGTLRWIVQQDDPPGVETTLGLATWAPGGQNPEHTHPNAEEIVYVLEGEVEHTLGDQRATLRTGDLIVVPRDIPHRIINTSENPARLLVIFSSPNREFIPT